MTSPARFALVTGAGSGIGFATADRLAREGLDLGLVDLDEDGLERATRTVRGHGRAARTAVLDVTDDEAFERALPELLDGRAAVDVLVNNAGIGVASTVVETSRADWDRTLAVNLSAMFVACRAVLPDMIRKGEGVIVNVSSVAGVVGVRNRAAYCASKAGVIGLTRAIAVDHAGEGIRANAICPGTVATEWIGKILSGAEDPEGTRRAMELRQLDGRMGLPEEVAAGIAFLASPDARFVNGSAFVMDGGMTAI